MPSRDFTSEDLFSSRMMSMQSATHSSQMKTVGPAMSLRTSCWLLPQNEQYRVFLESLPPTLLIPFSVTFARTHFPTRHERSKLRAGTPTRRPYPGRHATHLPHTISEAC